MAKRSATKKKPNRAQLVPTEVSKSSMQTPPQIVAAEDLSGMLNSGVAVRPFGPGEPIGPYDGYSRIPRGHDYRTGVNIGARPRHDQRVSFDTLKAIVKNYDIAQMCIWHRIDSLRSLDWNLTVLPGYQGDGDAAIAYGMAVLRRPDRKTPFKTWLAKLAYDTLAYDAGALYRIRNNAGRVIGLKNIDGTTLAPLIDYWGDRPDAPAPAFVQYVNGVPWNWLTEDDIIYTPFRPSTESPYGQAPIESILLNANLDLRFQAYFMGRFTDGNVPEGFASAPEGWTPQQIEDFQAQWDAMLAGDIEAKHQVKWVPNGTELAWSNEKDFDSEFSLFLMRKTMAAYHVVPADMGYTEDVNKSSGDTQADVQFRVGELPLDQHFEGILDDFLQLDLDLPLKFNFDTGKETESLLEQAQADEISINTGVLSISEVREMRHGLAEPGGSAMPRFYATARGGPIPLSAVQAVAGEIDPETGAPMPGAELSKKPFSPVEGVVPNPPPPMPALAVQKFGDQGAPLPDVQNPLVTPAALVAPGTLPSSTATVVSKSEGATAVGITADTGTYSTPLLTDPDDDVVEFDADGRELIAKSTELASFRRFAKARAKAGRWRDFTFTAVDQVEGHRLNDQARAQIRKDAGQLIAAGLCVRALETGRVLMLQRGLDPTDPASGTWEFPGGHIEDGETTFAAAVREWQEETGCLLPIDYLTAQADETGWTSPNGIYAGFVVDVPDETTIDYATRGQVSNPDDPDGDAVESIAWWDPNLLPGNPAIRAELAADIDVVLSALGRDMTEVLDPIVKAASDPRWHAAPIRQAEEKLVQHHAGAVQSALKSTVTKSQLRSLVEAYVAKSGSSDG